LGFQNISEAGGVGLAVTGITIVFAALILVTLFIACLPRVLPLVNSLLPVVEGHHRAPLPAASPVADTAADDEIVAAVGSALHVQRSE